MKLKITPGFISPKHREASVCESCGEGFVCGVSLKGCWCVEVELSEKARQNLKTKFRNCLCRNCLEKYTAEEVEK
jgi:hypothetical protein